MSTHIRSSISATRGALIWDPLYLQQNEHSYKILCVCNKIIIHVRGATRGARMYDPLCMSSKPFIVLECFVIHSEFLSTWIGAIFYDLSFTYSVWNF